MLDHEMVRLSYSEAMQMDHEDEHISTHLVLNIIQKMGHET